MADAGRKDIWDKLQAASGLLTAMVVAMIGVFSSNFLERQQEAETNVRLYTELMSRREEAESNLRKDMFVSIINSFLQPNAEDQTNSDPLDSMLLKLELLTYNFHESLNLKPLFTYLQRKLPPPPNQYSKRLNRVAGDVTRRQLLALEGVGRQFRRSISFRELDESPSGVLDLPAESLELNGIQRTFKVSVLRVLPETQEVRIRLRIETPGQPPQEVSAFSVGFFDFPMIDNTRLPNDQRYAVVLDDFGEESAGITTIYFPGEYASLKEKPYLADVLKQLQAQGGGS